MKKLLTLFISLTALNAGAQLESCNAFLQGHYVEVGISPMGSFGSSVATPAGYHGNVNVGSTYTSSTCSYTIGTPHLGFVADPAMDGWDVGTPAYMGDYFLPGSPFEGWELQIGTDIVQAYNEGSGFFGSLSSVTSGSNISYAIAGSTVTSTWQGTVDSIGVTQMTTLDTNGLYFTMQVTLTNLSSSPINDVYYMRSLDPDNLEVYDGAFGTFNTIAGQGPDSPTIVTASAYDSTEAIVPLSQLSLGSTDTNTRCLIYETWPLPATHDLAAVYDTASAGGFYYTPGYSNYADDAIGLVYHIAHLASIDSAADSVGRTTAAAGAHPANKAVLTFFYAFSQAGKDSAIHGSQSLTNSGYLSIKNVNTPAAINVYPNPSTNTINVTNLNTGDQLELVDMMGKATMLNGNISGNGTDKFSVSQMISGNYILLVKDAEGNVRSRTTVQKQ